MPKYTEADIVSGKRVTKNGMLAGYVNVPGKDKPQFRFISLVDPEAREASLEAARSSPRKKITPRSAKMAFNRFYKKRTRKSGERYYKTERGLKGAMTRDACWDNHPKDDTTRYRRSPHRYDYPGLDDGSNDKMCPGGAHNWKSGKAPVSKLKKGSEEAKAWGRKMKAAKEAKAAQQGVSKRPVSLKTAVRLLRQYYEEKYA